MSVFIFFFWYTMAILEIESKSSCSTPIPHPTLVGGPFCSIKKVRLRPMQVKITLK